MAKKRFTNRHGFTLIEVMIAIAIIVIPILGVGILLADGQRGWNMMYNKVYSELVTDSRIAAKMFEMTVRKASWETPQIGSNGEWIEVCYYADSDSTAVDRYARFYVSGGQLNIEYGQLEPKTTLSTQTICGNVSSCVFKLSGRSAQMILTLDNGRQDTTVVSSAVMYNR